MIWGIIIIAAIVLDQVSKYLINRFVDYGSAIPVIDKFFYITYSRNKGAAWGIFQDGRFFFIGVTLIVAGIMAYMLVKSENKVLKTSLSLILGGAVGNLIDRILVGSVTDFLDFYFGSYNFPTFNIADSFVVVGTCLLSYYLLFIQKDEEKMKAE